MGAEFRIGFTGSTLNEILPWAVEQVEAREPDLVLVAMAGSGKDIAALARRKRAIVSFDPQELSRCVIEGVFCDRGVAPTRFPLMYAKGYTYEHRPISGMPDDAAKLCDYLAIATSDYDRVALAQAIIRSTYMGRLKTWARDSTVHSLYAAYERAHARLEEWRDLPGAFEHTKGSVFDSRMPEVGADVVYVDTPKVINRGKRGDIYSAGFEGLNSILAQEQQVLPPWTRETYLRDMPRLWNGYYERLLLFHATGCEPTPDEVAAALHAIPDADVSVQQWTHGKRADICWTVDRRL